MRSATLRIYPPLRRVMRVTSNSLFPLPLLLMLLLMPVLMLMNVACKPTPHDAKAPSLRVGMELTYPPFETQDSSGKPDGVSVKLAEALAKHLQRPLVIVPMEFGSLTTALKTGNIDAVISSMTASAERKQSIDFSIPYAFTGLAMLVDKDSTIESIEDLKSSQHAIAVKSGTTSEVWASKNLPNTPRTAFTDDAACVMEVIQGRAAAFLYDQLSILRYHRKNPDTTRALLKPFTEESWAIGVAKNQPELLNQINEFLIQFRQEGGFETLAKQYLAEEKAAMEAANIPFMLR